MVKRCHLLLAAGILVPSGAGAQTCSAAAAQAIYAWEGKARTGLTETARHSTLQAFCGAAAKLSREEGVSSADVDAAAGDAISEYLDDAIRPGTTTLSMSDILGAQFSVNSNASIPLPRALGRIQITYHRNVDGLLVGGIRVLPYPALLSRLGDVAIAGLNHNATVCSGHVNVLPAVTAKFTC